MTIIPSNQLGYGEMLDIMSDHIIRSGIHEGWLEKVKESIAESSSSPNKDFMGLAIRLLYDMEWKTVQEIWTLPGLTPDVWARYEQFDLEDIREVTMLNTSLEALYSRFRTIMKM